MILKSDFVRLVAKKGGYNICDIERVFDDMLNVISETVASGETIKLVGLGTFISKDAPTKTTRPGTTEVFEKEPTKIVKFKISHKLRDSLR